MEAASPARLCPICGASMNDELCPIDGVRTVDAAALTVWRPSNLELGMIVAGRYRVDRLLGQGAMGSVYAATQLSMKRPVALKVLQGGRVDGKGLRRFFREAKSASQLRHPNVIHVLDFGVDDALHLPYLAMELVQGPTLSQLVAREGPLEPERAMHILEQVARALTAAHRAGIVHRDLKPENVMVQALPDDEEHVTVLDFGIARATAGTDGEQARLTATGMILGTPRYMSPEQVRGVPARPASDLYSLGCILHEVLTGAPPFVDSSLPQLIIKHVSGPRPALPDHVGSRPVPPGLRALQAALLQVDPERRPQSASAVARVLRKLAAGVEVDVGQELALRETSSPPEPTAPGADGPFEPTLEPVRADSPEPAAPVEGTDGAAGDGSAFPEGGATGPTSQPGARPLLRRRRRAVLGGAVMTLSALTAVIVAAMTGGGAASADALRALFGPSARPAQTERAREPPAMDRSHQPRTRAPTPAEAPEATSSPEGSEVSVPTLVEGEATGTGAPSGGSIPSPRAPDPVAVRVESIPSRAEVRERSRSLGRTPLMVEVRASTRELTLHKSGFRIRRLVLDPGGPAEVRLRLVPRSTRQDDLNLLEPR